MQINSFRQKGSISATELISLKNISKADIFELLCTAKELKTMSRFGDRTHKLSGKNIVNITKNSSVRSRVAFEIATRSLEANPISVNLKGSRIEEMLTNNESLRVINRFGISAAIVETDIWNDVGILARNLDFPVINANEQSSPCQSLAALLAVWEKIGRLDRIKVTIIGDVNLYDNSTVYGFAKSGAEVTILAPKNSQPSKEFLDYLKQFNDSSYTDDSVIALKNADIVFCCHHDFGSKYLLTKELFASSCPNALYLQNIPLERGKQANGDLIDSYNSLVYEQGENVMHIERAAIYLFAK